MHYVNAEGRFMGWLYTQPQSMAQIAKRHSRKIEIVARTVRQVNAANESLSIQLIVQRSVRLR